MVRSELSERSELSDVGFEELCDEAYAEVIFEGARREMQRKRGSMRAARGYWLCCLALVCGLQNVGRCAGRSLIWENPSWVEERWERLTQRQREMIEDGYLDVTIYDGWQGHAVDPAGKRDSLAGLQQAVNDARDCDLISYFPAGTYLVSGELDCGNRTYGTFPSHHRSAGRGRATRAHTVKLYGERGKQRPVIRLMDGAAGYGRRFDRPGQPEKVMRHEQGEFGHKFVVKMHQQGWGGSSTYFLVLDGIDIHCGAKNPGAIGLYHHAAQGAALMNVKITATGAFAGLYGGTRAAAGIYDLEIDGGEYGIVCQGNPPVLIGVTLRDQKKAALYNQRVEGCLTVCGFKIVKDTGPVLLWDPDHHCSKNANSGHVGFVDGTLELRSGGPALANPYGKNIYLRNVYVRGASAVVANDRASAAMRRSGLSWSRVKERIVPMKPNGKVAAEFLVDGRKPKSVSADTVANVPDAGVPKDLIARHLWGDVPEYVPGDPTVKNAVRDLGLDNKGEKVVSQALQAAIDRHEKIFLPKGVYLIDRTLVLRKHTKLFGAECNKVMISAVPDWIVSKETPIITTEDAADATTYLSDIRIGYYVTDIEVPGPRKRWDPKKKDARQYLHNLLTWRAGRRSVVRRVIGGSRNYYPRKLEKDVPGPAIAHWRITGSGGGKWFSCVHEHQHDTQHDDYNILAITDTREPCTIYHYGGIHKHGAGTQTMIRNSANKLFIGYNNERGGDVFGIVNSRNIGFLGMANGGPKPGTAYFRFVDSRDVLVANSYPYMKRNQDRAAEAFVVHETTGGETNAIGFDKKCALFKRGRFDDSVWRVR